jgi:hypothetical protein
VVTGLEPPGQLSSVSRPISRNDSDSPLIATLMVSPSTTLVSFIPSIFVPDMIAS